MDSEDAAVQEVSNGKADAVIIFPQNFTQDVYTATNPTIATNSSSSGTSITIRDDESVVNIKTAILVSVTDALSTTMTNQGVNPSIKVNADPVYGQNAQFIDFIVPGIMAFIVYLLTTLLTLLAFVGERTTGTLERVLSTPIQEVKW